MKALKPSLSSLILILLLMVFQSADAFFTILALNKGATEFNFVMNELLKFGFVYFLFYKLIVTNLLILFIGLVGRRYETGRIGLSIAVLAYTILTCYHLLTLSLAYLTASGH